MMVILMGKGVGHKVARRTLVSGGTGQLGVELMRRLGEDVATAPLRGQFDVSSAAAVDRTVGSVKPDLIIHAGAMTAVDMCEDHRLDAYRANAVGTWNLARAADRVGAEMVYVSTNYVFPGDKLGPYLEYDSPRPINAYGQSKYHGELAAQQVLDRLYVVRTSWLYSRWRKNFVTSFIRRVDKGVSGGEVGMGYVGDQVANPTHAGDLAAAIIQLSETGAYGTHHLVNGGGTSWYGWALAILRELDVDGVRLDEISADEFERPAAIPANSELGNEMARSLGISMRPWNTALVEFIRELRAQRE